MAPNPTWRWTLRPRTQGGITILVSLVFCLDFASPRRLNAQTDLLNIHLNVTVAAGQPVQSVAISARSDVGAVATGRGEVGIFSLREEGPPQWLAEHRGAANVVVFNRSGSTLASGGNDDIVKVIRLTDDNTQNLRGRKHHVLALAFSPDGRLLASGGEDKYVIVWDSTSGTELPHTAFLLSKNDAVYSRMPRRTYLTGTGKLI